ncbi:MAG: hypothetical protein B7Z55_04905 [Planctomycetales bacterium 12-60-4]|nr:MAG: hypothetical protein B7Z55_04905 [Planctomycetales bacterium 12-60-4]
MVLFAAGHRNFCSPVVLSLVGGSDESILMHTGVTMRPNRTQRKWWQAALVIVGGTVSMADLWGQTEPATEADRMFQSLDTNRDGRLNLDDVRNNNRALLEQIVRMAEKPATGSVTRTEFDRVFEAHRNGQRGNAPRPADRPATDRPGEATPNGAERLDRQILRWCDENGDGRLTRTEWSRLTQLFTRHDANRDGTLDAGELAALSAGLEAAPTAPNTAATPSTPRAANNAPTTPTTGKPTADAKGLDGVWRGWVVRGRGEDPNSGEMEVELTIRGNRIDGRELGTNRAPEGGLGSGVFTLAGDGKSGTLDAEQTSGPQTGRNYLGIYEIAGDTLRWCVTARNRERPASMATDRGTFLMILRRQ